MPKHKVEVGEPEPSFSFSPLKSKDELKNLLLPNFASGTTLEEESGDDDHEGCGDGSEDEDEDDIIIFLRLNFGIRARKYFDLELFFSVFLVALAFLT